jgi:kynurenine formamidase
VTPESGLDIDSLMRQHNNWGRWGEADELGTLNLVSPEVVLRGARSVQTGLPIGCARVLSRKEGGLDNPIVHVVTTSSAYAPASGCGWSCDWIGLEPHGFEVTHLDSLSHAFWNRKMYNGHPADRLTVFGAAECGSVEGARSGIVTRGVLFDVPKVLGRPWIEPAEPIDYSTFEECERRLGATVGPGDALLIRTGRDAQTADREKRGAPWPGFAGLSTSCIRFLAERDVALMGSDAIHDITKGDMTVVGDSPIHALALVGLGLWLLDNMYLEDLAGECEKNRRWSFQLLVGPLRIKNGTGSPVSPIAVL